MANILGHQTANTANSFTLAVTQDPLGAGDFDVFYVSSYARLLGEPTQDQVDSGQVKKYIVDTAITSKVFGGLNPGELHWVCAYRHSGGNSTRWGYVADDYKIPECYTRATVWEPIARSRTYIENWLKGWANWIGEVNGPRGSTPAAIKDNFVEGEKWSLYPESSMYQEDEATGGAEGGVPCTKQGWSTDEPLTVEFDFAHYSDPLWWDLYDDPWDALGPEYAFYRTIACMMSGESSYALVNSDIGSADYHNSTPDMAHAFGYIRTNTRPDGGFNIYDEPLMVHHIKIVFDGRTPSFPTVTIDGETHETDWWGEAGYMAGAFGAPQHFWTGSYYLLRGPMTFTGKPLYASFSDHLGWQAWHGNFNVGMGGENLGYQHGVFPKVVGSRDGQFQLTLNGSKDLVNGPWAANSPIFPADESMPWQKIRYGGVSPDPTFASVSVKVFDAADDTLLATDTPTTTYGQREIDLTPHVGKDIYIKIEGNNARDISSGTSLSQDNYVAHIGYLYIETDIIEPATYDLAINILSAILQADGTINISSALSGAAHAVLGASGIVPALVDSSGQAAVIADANGQFISSLDVEATASLVAQVVGAIEIISGVAGRAFMAGDMTTYDLAINLLQEVSYPEIIILSTGEKALHLEGLLYKVTEPTE